MSVSRFNTPTRSKSRSEINSHLEETPAKPSSVVNNDNDDHPLLLELASLRTSLRKFQHVSHSSSMQLQSKMMESLLVNEQAERLKRELEAAKTELEALHKSTPDPFPTPSSQALSELTLAHRRLSSKLDHTQEAFEASQKVVAVKEAEAATWKRERDAMGVVLQEWRDRVIQTEREREEERTRRIGVEEELRVLRGGFPESQLGVSGGGLAVQPADQPDGQHATLAEDTAPEPISGVDIRQLVFISPTGSPAPSHSPAELQGLNRLTADFTTSLGACHEKIAHLETLADELKASKDIAVKEADEARSLYAKVQGEIEGIRAEDFGAGKVVERYMAFTQKMTQQLHTHMQTANNRLSLTVTNLRSQLFATQTLLSREESRSKQLRAAIDELAEGYERETFGRRREVGLRMKALEREERRDEQGRRWVDRVRRERTRLDVSSGSNSNGYSNNKLGASPSRRTTRLNSFGGGANAGSASSTSLSSMLGSPAPHDYAHGEQLSLLWDLLESGLQLFKDSTEDLVDHVSQGVATTTDGDLVESPIDGRNLGMDSSLGRILLAQEIVTGLTADLEREVKRNVELERERLGFLSNKWDEPVTAEPGQQFQSGAGGQATVSVIDEKPLPANETPLEVVTIAGIGREGAAKEDARPAVMNGEQDEFFDSIEEDSVNPPTNLTSSEPTPTLSPEVESLLNRLRTRNSSYRSTQKALHDCALSLTNLRGTRQQLPAEYQTALQILLDGIHDVIEDVRVEVEIAIADDDRSAKGHQTVLSLQGNDENDGIRIQVSKAADAFLDPGRTRSREGNFDRRLGDVEHDLVEIKMAILDVQSGEALSLGPHEGDLLNPHPLDAKREETFDPFTNLILKTVNVRTPNAMNVPMNVTRPAVSPGLTDRPGLGNNMKRGFFPALSRTFSGTTPVVPLSRAVSSSNIHLNGNGNVGTNGVRDGRDEGLVMNGHSGHETGADASAGMDDADDGDVE